MRFANSPLACGSEDGFRAQGRCQPSFRGEMGTEKKSWWVWGGAAVLLVALIAAGFLLPVRDWAEALRDWLRERGAWGVVLFALIYIAGVVALVPGAILSITAGLAYGLWGIPLVIVAATIGASLAFLVARHLGHGAVAAFVRRRRKARAVQEAVNEEGWKVVGLLRLSPLVPFNLQNYYFGITDIAFAHYVAATFVGIIPGAIVEVYLGVLGGEAASGTASAVRWGFFAAGLVATIVVAWIVARKAKEKLAKAGVS